VKLTKHQIQSTSTIFRLPVHLEHQQTSKVFERTSNIVLSLMDAFEKIQNESEIYDKFLGLLLPFCGFALVLIIF